MAARAARAEADAVRASGARRAPARRPGRGLLLLFVLLAVAGVGVAGSLRPALDPPGAEAGHVAATRADAGEETIFLGELERRPSAPDRDDDSEGGTLRPDLRA